MKIDWRLRVLHDSTHVLPYIIVHVCVCACARLCVLNRDIFVNKEFSPKVKMNYR
jgi:hypothetical protein